MHLTRKKREGRSHMHKDTGSQNFSCINKNRKSGAIPAFFRVFVFLIAVLTIIPAASVHAADMRHRLDEHLLEVYVLGSLGGSLTGRNGETVPGYLHSQFGLGISFPGSGCMRLGVWGLELSAGPVMPMNPDLDFDIQLSPGLVLELPISNFQIFTRASALLPVSGELRGLSMSMMAGWYARPVSWRVGLVYDFYENGRIFTGLRFEMLWLGDDPH